jgi:ribosomal protein S18 acetylase RimI-like enzyme
VLNRRHFLDAFKTVNPHTQGQKVTIIRPAIESDISAIQAIANKNSKMLGYVRTVALRESMARNTLLVAELEGEIVGFVNYRACRDRWQTIYEIATAQHARQRGIGKSLIENVPKPIRLKCTAENNANGFYEHIGFELSHEEEGKKRRLKVWHLLSTK